MGRGKRANRSGTRLQNSYSRRLAKAIEDAGGNYTITKRGHFRVTGPDGDRGGVAFVSAGESSGRVLKQAMTDIRRHAGLVVVL